MIVCPTCVRSPIKAQSTIVAADSVTTPKKAPPMDTNNLPRADVSGIRPAPFQKITSAEASTPALAPVYRNRLGQVPDCPHRVCTANRPPLPRLKNPTTNSIPKKRPARLVPSGSGWVYVLIAMIVDSSEQRDIATVPAANWREFTERSIMITLLLENHNISGRKEYW